MLVASIGNGMQVRRMEVATKLWAAGIEAEFGFKKNPKVGRNATHLTVLRPLSQPLVSFQMGDQLTYAFDESIPFVVLFGENEISRGLVKVKVSPFVVFLSDRRTRTQS